MLDSSGRYNVILTTSHKFVFVAHYYHALLDQSL